MHSAKYQKLINRIKQAYITKVSKKNEENGTLDDLSRSGRRDAIKRDDFEAVALAIETIQKAWNASNNESY